MVVAGGVEVTGSPPCKSCGGVLLRVELYKLQTVCSDESEKAHIMGFIHGVVKLHIIFVLYRFNPNTMFPVFVFGAERRQCNAAAADERLAAGIQHITANGTEIETAFQKITAFVLIGNGFSAQKLHSRNAECGRKRLKQRNIGKTAPRFPFGNGFVADRKHFAELFLRQSALLPQFFQHGRRNVGRHNFTSFFNKLRQYRIIAKRVQVKRIPVNAALS